MDGIEGPQFARLEFGGPPEDSLVQADQRNSPENFIRLRFCALIL